MDTKKMAATFVILMMALGIAGFAYAHWSTILTINGTVSTGNVDAELSWEIWFSDTNNKTYGEVATCEVIPGDHMLNITIDNIYPCLWMLVVIDVHNTGSIPIGVYDEPNVTWDCGMEAITDGIDDGGCGWYGATPWQIDPCETTYFWIIVHFGENTPQNVTGKGSISVEFANWNEVLLGPDDYPNPMKPDTTGLYLSCYGPVD